MVSTLEKIIILALAAVLIVLMTGAAVADSPNSTVQDNTSAVGVTGGPAGPPADGGFLPSQAADEAVSAVSDALSTVTTGISTAAENAAAELGDVLPF